MPRPRKFRRICCSPEARVFGPLGQRAMQNETLIMTLDEIKQCKEKETYAAVYDLGNGVTKSRLGADRKMELVTHFRTVVISNGEQSLQEHLRNDCGDVSEGQLRRQISIPLNQKNKMRIILIDMAPRLLTAFSKESSDKVEKYLSEMGVEIMTNTGVVSCSDAKLTLDNGVELNTLNIFWVAGVKANSIAGLNSEAYGAGNRLKVDEFNRVIKHDNIFKYVFLLHYILLL